MTPETKARLIAAVACPALIFSMAHHASARPLATLQAPAAAPTAETRLPHISVVETGQGSPVVLIPGLSSPRAVWDGIAPALAKHHRVILVQVNGFAGDAPGANLQPGILPGAIADLHGYLVQHKLTHAAVIGHSMGGLLALMLAKAHPADASKLLIVDSLPWYGILFGPTATVAAVEPQAQAMKAQLAAGYAKDDPAADAQLAEKFALKPDSRTAIAGWMGKADARVSAEAMYEDLTTDLRGDMAGIATPITLLYPTSAALPQAVAEPIYKGAYAGAPHVTFVPVADSAHFIMLDQPTVFASAVNTFLGDK